MRKFITQIDCLTAILLFACCNDDKPFSGGEDFLINGNKLQKLGEDYLGDPDNNDTTRVYPINTNTELTFTFVSQKPSHPTISWDFGDGNTAQGDNVTHQYTTSGRYKVACRNDSSVYISKFVFAAAVEAPPPAPPVPVEDQVVEKPTEPTKCTTPPTAKCTSSLKKTLSSSSVVIVNVQDVDNGSSSYCNEPLEFSLSQKSFRTKGNYPIVLTVKDKQGSSTCSTTLEVLPAAERKIIPPLPPKCPPTTNSRTVAVNQKRDEKCTDWHEGSASMTINAKKCLSLRSAIVWADACGRLTLTIKGPGLNSDDVVILTEGRNEIPLQELYAALKPGETYTLTFKPQADEACGSTVPRLKNFSKCESGTYSDDYLGIQQTGAAVLFTLKYAF